jgi:uncharacterized protein YjbJ (UPF0337 family)
LSDVGPPDPPTQLPPDITAQRHGGGAMDRAKGRLKEASGALTGDKDKKSEGRSDQRKGKAKEKKGGLKDLLK